MRRPIPKTNPFYDLPRFAFGYEFVENGARVLDYGCYTGWFGAKLLEHKQVDYYGADKNADIVPCAPGLRITSIRDALPFADDFFDIATIFEVIEHVHDQDAVLREIHRVLKPGGVLIVTTPRKHVFSFLDYANWKFVFPRMHRLFFSLRHSDREYRYRYLDNPYGLVGDIEKEKSWHQHFTEREMRSLIERNGFAVDEMDGSGLLSSLFDAVGVIPPLGRVFTQRLRNWDTYAFHGRSLYCAARKRAHLSGAATSP